MTETTPAPQPTRTQWVGACFKEFVIKNRVTLAITVSMWILLLVSGGTQMADAWWRAVAVGPEQLKAGHWWTPLTSIFFAGRLSAALWTTAFLLTFGAWAERRLGALRYLWIGIATQAVAAVLGCGIAVILRGPFAGWGRGVGRTLDVGPTPFLAGVFFAATAHLDTLWRRRLRVTGFVTLATLFLFSGRLQDIIRFVAALLGWAIGSWLWRAVSKHRSLTGTAREGRVLVALTIAALAVATILTALTPGSIGPLAAVGQALSPARFTVDDLNRICADPDLGTECQHVRYLMRQRGPIPVLSLLAPQLFTLLLADGLRRGRKLAWWSILLLNLVQAGIAVANIVEALENAHTPELRRVLGVLPSGLPGARLTVPLLVPLGIMVLLLVTRSLFKVATPPQSRRRLLVIVGTAFVAGAVLSLGGIFFANDFVPTSNFAYIGHDYLLRLLPAVSLLSVSPPLLPLTPPAAFFSEWPPLLVWTTILIAFHRSFVHSGDNSGDLPRERFLALMKNPGAATTSWWGTWQGNSYWFSPTVDAAVAYQSIGGVALTVSDPACRPDDAGIVVHEFADWATAQGLVPAFYSVHEPITAVTRSLGWTTLQVAEETVLDLPTLEFKGKKFQDIRTAINKAVKQNVHTEWTTFHGATPHIRNQILAISEEWVADKKLPEMGFTLGGIDELDDPDVALLIAIDDEAHVHGVTSWMPVYRDGVKVGLTLDFMRRRADGFSSAMELLIGQAALDAKADGLQIMSLSGAPLARAKGESTADLSTLDRMLDLIAKTLEPVYGFQSLLNFKAKFQPRYEPITLAVPDATTLPSVGLAIGHAYLPNLSMKDRVAMGQTLLGH